MFSSHELLERERELLELDRLVGAARAGHGRLALIEGPAGIGKTRLLDEARLRAEAARVRVLTARGGELERDFGFGIARQLLEPVLARADRDMRTRLVAGAARLAEPAFATVPGGDVGAPDPTQATLHGLYWLVANLAELSPLLLSVDDVQWADRPSLRFLIHLARRLDGLAVVVALATRTGEEVGEARLLQALLLEAGTPVLRPKELSEEAVAAMVAAELGEGAGPMLSSACHAATGGNPFLLSELLDGLRHESRPAAEINPALVARLASERIAASVLLRVGRIAPEAPRLARSVAVLGAEASLADAASLAGLEQAQARSLAVALSEASVLERGEPLRFVHPIVRTAVYEEIRAPERAVMHQGAARLLAERKVRPEAIAVHLLATDPAGDGSAVETLLTAAGAALAAGAPEAAEAYLRRALAEPPADADRPELLRMLGRASARAGRLDAAADALKQGLTLVDESVPRARLAIDLAQALRLAGDLAEALKVLEEARERLGDEDRELALWLEAEIAVASHTGLPAADWIGRLAAVVASATGPTPAERSLRALYSYAAAASGKLGAPEVETLARSALPTAPASPAPLILLQTAAAGLAMAGRPGEALAVLDQALDQARRLGDSSQFGFLSLTRTWVALRAGRVHEAEADARAALASCEQGPYNLAYAIGSLVAALIERGELEPAHAALAEHGLAETRNLGPLPGATLLNARGRLRRLQGRLEDALADLHGCGEMVLCAGLPSPTFMEWRMDSALAHLALDQVEAARRLAAEDLELAHRFGARRELGMALRTMGLVEGGERGLELLRESVAVLDRSEGRLEHARSLVELGAALRRAGHRTAARESLTAGMDLAHRCGADAIVEHAYSELRAAGARPRRAASTGTEALTPSERRVTEMAAEGMTNKEIAQALFVTVRTVEMHVTNAYRKLEINSREELPAALDTA